MLRLSARQAGLICGLLLGLWSAQAAAETRRVALLVGVSRYADAAIPALEGPGHDVAAVKAALLAHWGFREADVRVLQDSAATRQGILQALQALEAQTAPGDHVFIYFSGHGTSALDKDTALPLPHTSGAFIPYDLRTEQTPQRMVEQLLVGQRDLRPIFSKLDAGGRKLLVVSDSCYSGQAVRSLGPRADGARLVPRSVSLKGLASSGKSGTSGTSGTRSLRPEPAPYPYEHVFYVAAASDSEQAMDIRRDDLRVLPTVDNQPHGALTDALLRALTGQLLLDRNRDGVIDHAELFTAINTFMTPRGYPHTPQVLPSAAEDRVRMARVRLFDQQPSGGAFEPAPPLGPPGGASAPREPIADGALRVRLEASARHEGRTALQPLAGLSLMDTGSADFSLRAVAGDWQLLGPAGDLVLQAPLAQMSLVKRRLEAALWLRRLARQAQPQTAFTLELQPLPSTRGGSFVEGEHFTLALRSQRHAHVLLLAIDPQGKVNLLYPYSPNEKAAHGADVVVITPPQDSPIAVTPPFGTDELLAIAFEQPPAFWAQLPQRDALSLQSPLLAAIERAVSTPGVRIATATTLIRSLPKLP